MALKLVLKPNERVIIGDCIVTNDDQRTALSIDGTIPILREKDVMAANKADSPAKRIYLAIQMMYLSRRPQDHHVFYFRLVREILSAAPSMRPYIERINNRILTGEMYKALRETRKLVACERELLDHAIRQRSLRENRQRSI